MAEKEFKLPDVGEGLTEADIVAWHVKPGEAVEDGQIIVEIETAKAVVELPCPWDGTVTRLLAEEGQTVEVGVPIIAVEVAGQATPIGPNGPRFRPRAEPRRPRARPDDDEAGAHSVLVGYGVKTSSTTRRAPQDRGRAPGNGRGAHRARGARRGARSWPPNHGPPSRASLPRPARWPSRRCASWPRTSASAWPRWRAAARTARSPGTTCSGRRGGYAGPFGPIRERIPDGHLAYGPRRRGAHTGPRRAQAHGRGHGVERVHRAARHRVPPGRRDRDDGGGAPVRELPEFAELRVSPLLFVARALLVAVARHPLVNSSWDAAAEEIVVKHYVNLGIAVAAERGLIVPNVKHADALTLPDLARGLQTLTETARAGKATPADLAGGTITITNVGVFGVDAGTPILTPGETAILAFGQVKEAPWVVDGQLAVRQVCTLSLSFDHRIVDGELGSAVLRDVGSMLTDPLRMLAWS